MGKTYRSAYIERLNTDGALYQREILNILLSNAYAGKDMSDVADKLLQCFPSIGAIISASKEELIAIDGVDEKVANYFKTLDAVKKFNAEKSLTHIKSAEDFSQIVSSRFRGRDNEYAELFFVNVRGRILERKIYTSDYANEVAIPTGEVVATLALIKPYGVYVAHNHVNCSPRPSIADDRLTEKLVELCLSCNVKFFDHLIINSSGEIYSYLQSGKLNL